MHWSVQIRAFRVSYEWKYADILFKQPNSRWMWSTASLDCATNELKPAQIVCPHLHLPRSIYHDPTSLNTANYPTHVQNTEPVWRHQYKVFIRPFSLGKYSMQRQYATSIHIDRTFWPRKCTDLSVCKLQRCLSAKMSAKWVTASVIKGVILSELSSWVLPIIFLSCHIER